MKNRSILAVLVCCFAASHSLAENNAPEDVSYINDGKTIQMFKQEMGARLDPNGSGITNLFSDALKISSCMLDLPPENTKKLSPEERYKFVAERTVVISGAFRSPNKKDKRWYTNFATGFIIHQDGILVTNYHVIERAIPNSRGIMVMTFDKKMYTVKAVLAAHKNSDIAIVSLNEVKEPLPFIPIARRQPAVGSPVALVTHPDDRFFTYSTGAVTRYFIDYYQEKAMAISADFAKGSSGGPVVDDKGNIIGLVVSTSSFSYESLSVLIDKETTALRKATQKETKNAYKASDDDKPKYLGFGHQMTFKTCSPACSILKLINPPE